MRIFYFFILFFSFLHGVEVDKKIAFQEILSHSSYYVDYNQTATIETIATKKFTPINDKELGFGYSPDFTVWIKLVLTNNSNKAITKIIEYNNPLTSFVEFYDAKSNRLLKSSGMLSKDSNESLTPFIKVTLKPHESRTFYIKIASKVTSLIARLNLWDPKEYTLNQKRNQIILALFFGGMGVIILYNIVIFFMTRKIAFFYYVVAFLGVFLYYLLYQGVAPLLFSKEIMKLLNSNIPFIVLFPVVFLSLFTKEILALHKNRKLNKIFKIIVTLSILSTFVFYALGLHAIRNLSYVILFFMLFGLTLYYYNKSSYAKYLLLSWIIFFLIALFMYLENIQIFSLSSIFPYYSEVALLFEALSFSLILAHYMEKLEKEIEYKELTINELDHRISGSLQLIKYKIHQVEREKGKSLDALKQNILAIGEIAKLLNSTHSFPKVHMQEYLPALITKLQKIYKKPNIHISIEIDPKIDLQPKIATSCAKIVHEALTNIYKYAYSEEGGEASVKLKREGNNYIFTITDNGRGIEKRREGARGLLLIEEIVNYELNGSVEIDSFNGVKITIRWQEDG